VRLNYYNYATTIIAKDRALTEITEPMTIILLRVKLHVFLTMTLERSVSSASLFNMKAPIE
jgi:hypothetical protein